MCLPQHAKDAPSSPSSLGSFFTAFPLGAPGTPCSGTSARPSSEFAASGRRGSEKRSPFSTAGEVALRSVGDVGAMSGAVAMS